MTAPGHGPWSASLVRRPDGYGVRVELDLTFPSREAAVEAGQALLGQLDVRLEALGRRLREEAAEAPPLPPEVADLTASALSPTFSEPS
jgi:hypothetical protein